MWHDNTKLLIFFESSYVEIKAVWNKGYDVIISVHQQQNFIASLKFYGHVPKVWEPAFPNEKVS